MGFVRSEGMQDLIILIKSLTKILYSPRCEVINHGLLRALSYVEMPTLTTTLIITLPNINTRQYLRTISHSYLHQYKTP